MSAAAAAAEFEGGLYDDSNNNKTNETRQDTRLKDTRSSSLAFS